MQPGLADHLLVMLLVLLPPLLGSMSYRRLKRRVAEGDVGVRLRYYRRTMLLQWLVTALVLAVWFANGRSLALLGLLPWRGAIPAVVGLVVASAAAFVLLRQHRTIAGDAAAAESARRQIEPLIDFLPHDAAEDRAFTWLSVTAGVCEEIAHRGFLIAWLAVWTGLWTGVGVSAVIFGISHAYQGASGMVRTGLVGLVAGVLYAASGWLLPAIVLHVAIDVGSGRVVRVVRPG